MQSPWSHPGEATKQWSVKFNLSGDVPLLAGEMEQTAIDLWHPIQQTTGPETSLIEWVYYPQGSTVKSGEMVYAAGAHPGNHAAYANPASQYQSMLEVALMARCPVGLNSRGKRVYLRKWIHGVLYNAGDPNTLASLTSDATTLQNWNAGSGPKALVPCDPTGGTIGGPWTFEHYLRTHQIRRGPKRKKVTTTVYVPLPIP